MDQGGHFKQDSKIDASIPHVQLLSGTESPMMLELENFQTPNNGKYS